MLNVLFLKAFQSCTEQTLNWNLHFLLSTLDLNNSEGSCYLHKNLFCILDYFNSHWFIKKKSKASQRALSAVWFQPSEPSRTPVWWTSRTKWAEDEDEDSGAWTQRRGIFQSQNQRKTWRTAQLLCAWGFTHLCEQGVFTSSSLAFVIFFKIRSHKNWKLENIERLRGCNLVAFISLKPFLQKKHKQTKRFDGM